MQEYAFEILTSAAASPKRTRIFKMIFLVNASLSAPPPPGVPAVCKPQQKRSTARMQHVTSRFGLPA
eukprot:366055-Chlamydomonas_euryale.AAC.10